MNLLVNTYPVGQYDWLNDVKIALRCRSRVLKMLNSKSLQNE